ncbi:MAG: hypothetical protein ACSLFD_09835 [Solirubrobacterales bacterium]
MIRRGTRSAVTIAAIVLGGLVLIPAATAIPWDRGGSISPGDTPAPVSPDPLCAESYADDEPRGGPPIRFGIGPRLAGEVGTGQTTPLVKVDVGKRDAALRKLAGDRSFTVRLNRLFMADGQDGIDRFRHMARHYSARGLKVELQVRYHPNEDRNGNIRAWVDYVHRVVRAFGPIRGVTGLQITNEVNLAFSPNTSDGFYDQAVNALIQGVKAAKNESRRRGYERLEIGFNYAWLFKGQADADFWTALGRDGGRALRRSTDWIGLDLYPGTYAPPASAITDYGDAFLEGLAQVRECYMPMAGFGPRVPLRIEETGWPTGPGRTPALQKKALRQFVTTAVRYRGTYGITDFRWFGLRDNNSAGPDYQSYFGLLDDRYRPKPAFGEYRRLVDRFGAAVRRR